MYVDGGSGLKRKSHFCTLNFHFGTILPPLYDRCEKSNLNLVRYAQQVELGQFPTQADPTIL